MGLFGIILRIILPTSVLLVALFIGWLSQDPDGLPPGRFFATIIPLMKGKLPPTIFGHGRMEGTPEVPDDMKPQARPANEMFQTLPGGYTMPQSGLGMCCRYSAYDDVLVRRTVLWYLLLGGRHIDGAHLYLNHKAIGEGIRDAIERGVPRSEIFVTTKIFATHYGYNKTKTTVPKYLDELGLEYIDLVLMHLPSNFPPLRNDCAKDGLSNSECRADTWKALSELREEGVMRNIGVSNFAINHLKEVEGLNLAPIAVNQFQYNPWAPDFQVEIFDYCQKENIVVTAYSSLGSAFQHAEATTVKTLKDISTKLNKTIAQVMLRWALQINAVVIPGTGNPNHMKENLEGVYSFELSSDDMERINKLRSDEGAKKFFYMKPPAD